MVNIFFARNGKFGSIDVAVNVKVEYFKDGDYGVDHTLNLIKDAVTEWICSTKEGLEVFNNTCEDTNIGDLYTYGCIEGIMPYLNKRGIKSIEGESIENPVSYDTILCKVAVIDDYFDDLEAE